MYMPSTLGKEGRRESVCGCADEIDQRNGGIGGKDQRTRVQVREGGGGMLQKGQNRTGTVVRKGGYAVLFVTVPRSGKVQEEIRVIKKDK
jgi:hypothetical protein